MKPAFLFFRIAGISAALFLCGGCLQVEDISEAWKTAGLDPALQGSWKKPGAKLAWNDEYISFSKKEGAYVKNNHAVSSNDVRGAGNQHLKTFQIGNATFLLLKDEFSKSKKGKIAGTLERYTIEDGKLIFYTLNDAKPLIDAIQHGAIKGRASAGDESGPPFISLDKLDKRTVDALAIIVADPKRWIEDRRYERVENLAEAMAKSRLYPATPDTPRNTRVDVDLPDLDYFADHPEILRRQLVSDPEWICSSSENGTFCQVRGVRDPFLTGPQKVFVPQEGVSNTVEINFSFFEAKAPDYYTNTGVLPLAKEVQVTLEKPGEDNIRSQLHAGRGRVWISISESGEGEAREQTRAAIAWLREYLKEIRAHEGEIEAKGFSASVMPAGAIQTGKPKMEISDGFQGGMYNVKALVNPGKRGRIYLKIFESKTGLRLSQEWVINNSRRVIGWSGDPSQLFYYGSNITIYEGGWTDFRNARFELWFKGDDKSPERKLTEMTRKICGWER